MPQKIRMWEVTAENSLSEIASSEINLEKRLEDWLEADISMLDPGLLVIGRQVRTDFGGEIDLLCLDSNGDTVSIELKKGKTPREVTAQALDYASWVRNLSYQRIEILAGAYLKGSLEEAFEEKFGAELPEVLNKGHRSLIVAESMDASTERIVQYLSDLNVPINVATVQHFKASDGREMLAQVYLVEPEVAAAKAPSAQNRRYNRTLSEVYNLAEESGVESLYSRLRQGMQEVMQAGTIGSSLVYRVTLDNRTLTVVIISPQNSSATEGLPYLLSGNRMVKYLGQTAEQIAAFLPHVHIRNEGSAWNGASPEERENWFTFSGHFRTSEDIDRFVDALKK